ncbi:MAG TPA: cupin domain-containing protein [Reyranella sp.]|nr:cupin domain-containing protein [Reyranella sp.]
MTETLNALGAPMMVKSDGHGVAMFLADHPVPPGYFVPPHRHDSDDELLFVVEGELTLIGEAGETRSGPGSCATFVRGVLHGFRNDTSSTVRLVVAATPGVQAVEMFRHFDRAAQEAGGSLSPSDIVAIAVQYGVSFG